MARPLLEGDPAHLARVDAAMNARRETRANADAADAEFVAAVREALRSGASPTVLTQMTGLSRSRLQQIKKGTR